MDFSTDPLEALAKIDRTCYDIIVTDMRMPTLDGAALLQKVAEKCPTSVRVVLSGQADERTILRCLPVAHQHIAKPAEVATIEEMVERTHAANSYRIGTDARSALALLSSIPMDSITHNRLQEELLSASPSPLIIADLASQQPAFGLKLLQLVNSSFFGHAEETTTPEQAVRRLGVDTIRKIVLEHKLLRVLDSDTEQLLKNVNPETNSSDFFLALVQAADENGHSFQDGFVGRCARLADTLFALLWPEHYRMVNQFVTHGGFRKEEAELAISGSTSKGMLCYLMTIWGIPQSLIHRIESVTSEQQQPIHTLQS